MNRTIILKRFLVAAFLTALVSTPCFAVEYYLRADTTTKTMPGNVDIPMWGFAQDTGFGALDGDVTVPGPLLTVPEGDPNLIIHLDNNLNVPVSIVINGQIAMMMPVRNPNGRVHSFTHETPPGNTAAVDYVWTNFRPGTYVYQSGTHVAVQVQMGLYGGVTRDFAAGQIYEDPNTAYTVQVPLFFSEIDTALHTAVATDNYGPGKAMTSTIDYEPDYFLINGQPFVAGQAALAAGNTGDTVLLRLFNMGLETRCPLLLGNYMTLIAEDGQAYQYPKQGYVANLTAGKTIDALATFSAAGTYPLFDRRLGLTNTSVSGGGMLTYLQVETGAGVNIAPVISSVTATPSSILDTQTSQLLVSAGDTDGPSPLSYNWIVPAGAGSVSNAAIANPTYNPPDVAATEIFTLTVEVSDGAATVSGTVEVTVRQNVAPVINSVTATPSSILDTETSQLLVSAGDTDGPSPLSYNWIVPAGAGSLSNAAIANPTYNPPNVAATEIFTLTVEVSDGAATVSGTVNITVANNPNIFTANFTNGTDSFAYLGNTFRGTTGNLTYERGDRISTGGYSGGALRIRLGGLDNILVAGMSGGWSRTFTLVSPGVVNISLRYNLSQSANYENTEYSDMMLAVDSTVIGVGANDYLRRIFGNGDGGTARGTGWQLFTTTISLPAGAHTITIGGYNNQKDNTNEMTTVLIDNVTLTRN